MLQACTSEQWDVAEALIKSGGMLEAQDKVINVTVLRLRKYLTVYTIVSRESAHGHSQVKHQNLGVGGNLEEVLE